MKLYYEKYGCSLNQGETMEIVESMLENGHELVSTPENADIIIIGTCVVIKHTENYMLRRIEELSKFNKKMVVYGCLPSIKNLTLNNKNISTIKPGEVPLINGIAYQPKDVPAFENTLTIPIAQGCTGHCTYCISKLARGRLRSYEPDKILEKFKMGVKKGFKEIRLSALDTASYGLDISTNLAELLNILSNVDGDFKIRVGMMEPSNTLKILPDLIESFKTDKIFKFFHVPFQSANDRILGLMGREYTSKEFKGIVENIRKNFEHYTFSTDVIVGFPGEDEDSFSETVSLVKNIRPDILNITRYSPREGTMAFKLKPVKSTISKEWSLKLTEMHRKISTERNMELLSSIKRVLVTEKGKMDYLARTDGYRPVILKNVSINNYYDVKIVGYSAFYLYGEIFEIR
ncbi:MAG: tRNA (N(6)-L-threonylcarbamoyladenosine(37)-C(2))-methylthiotransferase [Thermoplasmata archaeon]